MGLKELVNGQEYHGILSKVIFFKFRQFSVFPQCVF